MSARETQQEVRSGNFSSSPLYWLLFRQKFILEASGLVAGNGSEDGNYETGDRIQYYYLY
ncbi:hypothetical protein [Coleofasciculus sp. E1-EBD-02]|uniref:hypothetical protein n=1 Tax=Coleofasciculus sp. E1-EBD-02 TaxID=3068481 RepID=UPI004062C9A0